MEAHKSYERFEQGHQVAAGLQVGIVLASVSIIARCRWLLGAGGAAATAGVALLLVRLIV